jgi:hypothetical protein
MAEVINGVRVIPGTMLPESEWHEHVTKGGTADEFVKAHPGVKKECLTIKTVPYPRPVKHNVVWTKPRDPNPNVKRLLLAPIILLGLSLVVGRVGAAVLCWAGVASLAAGAILGLRDDWQREGTVDFVRLCYVFVFGLTLLLFALAATAMHA